MSYCVKCRSNTADKGKPTMKTCKNGRVMKQSICAKCGTKKCQFVSNKAAGGALYLPGSV